jgi:acetyl-CoA C-acetyltransferase
VIIAIGEVTDRPAELTSARHPVALMADALRTANEDAGGHLFAAIDSVDLVGQVTWRYADPVGSLCASLDIQPARRVNADMGGDTPIRALHDAAVRILSGASTVAVVVGGEAGHALASARRNKLRLSWPDPAPPETAFAPRSTRRINPAAERVGATAPIHVYPLYENAFQAARGQNPAEGNTASAALWARFAAVAAANPYAWIRSSPDAAEIAAPSPSNRPVAFPYTKLMVANPSVNQAAAVVVASLAWALEHGVAQDRLVYIWGGAAAEEPPDYLQRDRFDRSTAQEAVLDRATKIAGGDSRRFDLVELYSCFPVVPKMAMERLVLRAGVEPTVAGGLTFFGGPLNNYMSHAVCAMVRRLRSGTSAQVGLLYANGGVVSKHHSLVVATEPSEPPLANDYSVQAEADANRGPSPPLVETYVGPASVETFTVVYRADGAVDYGVLVLRTARRARVIARASVDDARTIAALTNWETSSVGAPGTVRLDPSGTLVWEIDREDSAPRRSLGELHG